MTNNLNLNNAMAKIKTLSVEDIKNIYHDLHLNHKEVLKQVNKICGKEISYPTLLKFLKDNKIQTRREMGARA